MHLRKIRSGWVEGIFREKGREHWLELLPICQRLTAFAAGINSNKAELAAVSLTSHTLSHAHSSPPEEQVNSLKSSQGPARLSSPLSPSLHVKLPLPPVLPPPNSPLFILPADSGGKHNEDPSDKKESYSTGWRDCARERERERNVIFEWLIKKWNRWEQSLSRRDRKEGLGIREKAARWLQAL